LAIEKEAFRTIGEFSVPIIKLLLYKMNTIPQCNANVRKKVLLGI